MRHILAAVAAMAVAGPGAAQEAARAVAPDPLGSGMWDSVAGQYFAGGPVVFDDRVRLMVPRAAEDQFFVPVTVDAGALEGVEEIVVVADLNPIQRALSFRPVAADPFIGLRLKVEQTTPVRAGARTSDGVWHMAARMVDAAGGGCTAPAQAHSGSDWMATLGATRGRIVPAGDGRARITLRIRHPMDTGLADGIPVFYLSDLDIRTATDRQIALLRAYEPISENPTFTLRARIGAGDGALQVRGRDTEGNGYAFALPLPGLEEK